MAGAFGTCQSERLQVLCYVRARFSLARLAALTAAARLLHSFAHVAAAVQLYVVHVWTSQCTHQPNVIFVLRVRGLGVGVPNGTFSAAKAG